MSAAHGRLAWLEPDELDEDRRAVYDAITGGPRAGDGEASPLADPAGRLEGPFNAMLFSPPVGGALEQLGSALRYRSSLSARARELAVLRVARHYRSGFEWRAHERLARRAGLSDAVVAAVLEGAAPPGLDDGERAADDAVSDLLASGDLDDGGFLRLRAAWGDTGAVELITLVGYYSTLALLMRALRVPLPAGGQEPEWPASG